MPNEMEELEFYLKKAKQVVYSGGRKDNDGAGIFKGTGTGM